MITTLALLMVTSSPRATALSLDGLFTPNGGQWEAQAEFHGRFPGGSIWVGRGGARYVITQGNRNFAFDLGFQGSSSGQPRARCVTKGTLNYLLGSNSTRHARHLQPSTSIVQEGLYRGFDVVWKFDAGRPRFDFEVAPHADPRSIRLRIAAAESTLTRQSSLTINSPLGPVSLGGIRAFQLTGGVETAVSCELVQDEHGEFVFKIGEYDRAKQLIIDPIISSTYIGSAANDTVNDVAVDADGFQYIVGNTMSATFPTTVGSVYETAPSQDCGFLAKLDPTGTVLEFATFFGSSKSTAINGVSLDPAGNIYIGGSTIGSIPLPISGRAFQKTASAAGDEDAFVAVIDNSGSEIVAATHLGGSGKDVVQDIQLQAGVGIVLCGYTTSSSFPLSLSPGPSTSNAGGEDGFIAIFSRNCRRLQTHSFLGGSSNDRLQALASFTEFQDPYEEPPKDGVIAVVGGTTSPTFPTKNNPWFSTARTGRSDADGVFAIFRARYFAEEAAPYEFGLDYATYFGGDRDDVAQDVCSNGATFFVSGQTSSFGPASAAAFPLIQAAFVAQSVPVDGFLVRLDREWDTSEFVSNYAISPTFSTFVAGERFLDDVSWTDFGVGRFCVRQDSDETVVVARSASAYVASTGRYYNNLSLSRFDFGGKWLRTVKIVNQNLPKANATVSTGLAVDQFGSAFVAGSTLSQSFPTTVDSPQPKAAGAYDGFLCSYAMLSFNKLRGEQRSIVGGKPLKVILSMRGRTPRSGLTCLLTTSNLAVRVPDSVTIPAGASEVSFVVTTRPVDAETKVDIRVDFASDAGKLESGSGAIIVEPAKVAELTLRSYVVYGGKTVQGTVDLDGVAPPAGVVVQLASSDKTVATVPATVIVAGGESNATFTISSKLVEEEEQTLISARANGTRQTQSLTVRQGGIGSFVITPPDLVAVAGGNAKMEVGLNAPAYGSGFTVNIAVLKVEGLPAGESLEDFVNVPATIGVARGQIQGSADILIKRTVAYPVSIQISARTQFNSVRAQLVLKPAP